VRARPGGAAGRCRVGELGPPGASASLGARGPRWRGCELASPFLAKHIQSGFCGIGQLTPEPAGPCRSLRPGRWVYEKGADRAAAGRLATVLIVLVVSRGIRPSCGWPTSPRWARAAKVVVASSRAHF